MKKKQAQPTSRGLSIDCLAQWQGSGKTIQGFLNRIIHESDLKESDRQLAVMLVMGVLRRQQYLDTIIASFSKTRLKKMKPLTLIALRVGCYQIIFLERIPDSAAVNETVKALKKMRQPGWLTGFVNGTLRAIARNRDTLPLPETAGRSNSPILEHPSWLTDRWTAHFGREKMEEICAVNNQQPQLCLRAVPGERENLAEELNRKGIKAQLGRYSPESLVLPDYRGQISKLPGYAQGLFHVQDQAAQLVCQLLLPLRPDGLYLDGCAGLGGKTAVLAGVLPQTASLLAVEPDARRARLLGENLQRLRLDKRVTVVRQRLEDFARTTDLVFDGILIDAPCSGTGVIRKHPDIRWNRQPEDMAVFQEQQLSLLHAGASLLAPGGVLVYATCSLEPEENREVVEAFLHRDDRFKLTDCSQFLPETAAELVDDLGCFAPLPSEEIEGFFAARLKVSFSQAS